VNTSFLFYHAESHVEAMKEDSCYPEGYLREVKKDASLIDEINTFRSPQSLLC
jgi:hypothetical protein